jgi:hypothetical protein
MQMQVPGFSQNGIFKLILRWERLVSIFGDTFESNHVVAEYKLRLTL